MPSLTNCGFVSSRFKILAVFQLYSVFPNTTFTAVYNTSQDSHLCTHGETVSTPRDPYLFRRLALMIS